MTISLAPELEGFINQKVASGLYNSANEVIREALQLLHEQDELSRIRTEELRREIQKGLDSLDQGNVRDGRTVMTELIAKYERKDDKNQRQEELHAEIQLGLDSLSRGEGDLWEIESIKTQGRKYLAAERDYS